MSASANMRATREALLTAEAGLSLVQLFLFIALNVLILLFVRYMILRLTGTRSLREAVRLLAVGKLARKRRVEERHLLIRGPHYKSVRDLARMKPQRVMVEKKPKDPSGGVRP